MSRVCPKCHRESPVDTDYCPACGAPMDEHVLSGQEKAARRVLDAPPMKWHKFLTWVSLPLSVVMAIVGLVQAWQTLAAFDESLYIPEYVSLVRFSSQLSVFMEIVVLGLAAGAEWLLLKMKWRGVRLLLMLYAVNSIYTAVTAYMLYKVGLDLEEPIVMLGGSLLMLVLTRIYYNKRRTLFS